MSPFLSSALLSYDQLLCPDNVFICEALLTQALHTTQFIGPWQVARSACSTFQAGRQSIKAGGCEIPAHADAATLPEKRNRPILHPGGPEHFPPTVQAGYERIKACRVVICKKRNSPFLHLTGGHLVFAASSFASPRGRWHRGAYLYLCLVATIRLSHYPFTGFWDTCPIIHHQLCRETNGQLQTNKKQCLILWGWCQIIWRSSCLLLLHQNNKWKSEGKQHFSKWLYKFRMEMGTFL